MRQTLFLLTLIIVCLSCKTAKQSKLPVEIHTIENSLLPRIHVEGEALKMLNIQDQMKHHNVPGASIAIVENGKLKWAKGYGLANTNSGLKVDENTIFQAGSISKPIAAFSALKLLEEGKVDLDTDVNEYLVDWQVPTNEFTKEEKVTLRRLLTHTAGMTVHGFPGYQQTDTFPSIIEVLNGEGNTGKIYVDTRPDSIWRYSGGGYTVMEKVVEDVSGMTLEEYMSTHILSAIGMKKSTYDQPLGEEYHNNASAAYYSDGKIIEGLWHNYPEQAAAGLWTTPTDLATYCIEIQQILTGKKTGVLSKQTIEKMLTKHKNDWGLGPSLQWEQDSLIFRHGGKNAGFTNEIVAFAHKGNAVIVMTNADNGGKLIGEILRGVSNYYDWGISKQQTVEVIEVETEELSKLTGMYILDFKVPNIGDYIIDITIRDGKLFVNDPNNGETNVLYALEAMKFIDLETGDEILFESEGDKQKVVFNSRFNFQKMDE